MVKKSVSEITDLRKSGKSVCMSFYVHLQCPFPLVLQAAVLSEGLSYQCNSGPCNRHTLSLSLSHTHRVTLAVCEASLCPWGVCFYPLIDNTMERVGLSAVQRNSSH